MHWHCAEASEHPGKLFLLIRMSLLPQELGQRSRDRLLGNTHRPVQDQPVCCSRAAFQSVSAMLGLSLNSPGAPKVVLVDLIVHRAPPPPPLCVLRRDFLTAEDKEGVFNADHFPLWYKRAAEQVPGTFIYSIPFGSGTTKLLRLKVKHKKGARGLGVRVED